MYAAIDLSKYIVSKCIKDGHPISNLQLQKILYYIQKAFLKEKGTQAFGDDIEAWQYGPVVPNAYYRFCGSGAMPISFCLETGSIEKCDEELINSIVEEKRDLNPWNLVADTHKNGGAWDKVYQNGIGNHKTIDTELIQAEA